MKGLIHGCSGKTLSQGGLNLSDLKTLLVKQFPAEAKKIRQSTRRDLESLCMELLGPNYDLSKFISEKPLNVALSSLQCLCIKSDGQQCTRKASKNTGDDLRLCWQHQNCKEINVLESKEKIGMDIPNPF